MRLEYQGYRKQTYSAWRRTIDASVDEFDRNDTGWMYECMNVRMCSENVWECVAVVLREPALCVLKDEGRVGVAPSLLSQ